MPQVALFLCVALIAFLLVRDVRSRSSLSHALWLPIVMLVILASRPLSEWLGASQFANPEYGAEGSPVERVFYLAIIVGCLLVASARHVKWSRILWANSAIMLLYLYFALSMLWSEDPAASFKRCAKDFGFLFVVAVILSEKKPLEAMRAVYVRCAYILIPLSVVLIRYFPDWGRGYTVAGEVMYTGVTPQKNTLGELVFISMLFLIWDWMEGRARDVRHGSRRVPWVLVLLLVMGFWLLNVSHSKSALISVLVGTALLVRGRRFNSAIANKIVFFGALSLPFVVLLTQEFTWLIAPFVEAMGRDLTFTGRTAIWSHINSSTVNPIIGAGFWNFWGSKGGAAIKEALNTGIPSAHNGYLDIYLDGGLIGLGLLFAVLLTRGRRFIRDIRLSQSEHKMPSGIERFQRFRFAFLIIAIIYNISESAFARPIFIWFTTLLVLYDFPYVKVLPGQMHQPASSSYDATQVATSDTTQFARQ
jgi:O-antigen ligase